MEQEKQTVAEVLLDQLSLLGVKRIYGVVGDTIIGLLDALAKQDEIQFIAVKHESAAAFMASAEAKLTGRIGVCTATMGPGAANLLNGLGDAYADHAPVLAITGQAPRAKIGTDFQQYVDQQELFKPFAVYSANLAAGDAVVSLLHKAAEISLRQRAVTHLSVPKDLFEETVSVHARPIPEILEGAAVFEEDHIKRVLDVMKTAKKPMILAGAGARSAAADVEKLAGIWGAGVLTSLGGKGLLDDSSPLLLQGIGEGGNPFAADVFKEADTVLALGTTWWPEGYVPEGARVLQIDSHLENVRNAIPAELGIKGKTEDVLPLLAEGLAGIETNTGWLDRCREAKDQWERKNEEEGAKTGSPVHPSRLVRALEKTINEDAVLAIDTGDVTVWMNRNFRQSRQRTLFSGYWRSMGFGLPAAIAAKLEQPDKQAVAVVGDGGLEMVLADLLTAKRYNLDLTLIVFNNRALQMENDKIEASGAEKVGTALTNPDFIKIAEACGWTGFRAESDEGLEELLLQAFETKGPVLVDVKTDRAFFPETE